MLRKYNSKVYEGALIRFQNVKAICNELGLEKNIPVDEFENELKAFGELQFDYNKTKSLLDGKHANIKDAEHNLRSMHERMLLSIAIAFGKNSPEYARAGGKRKVDRKRHVFKPKKKQLQRDGQT